MTAKTYNAIRFHLGLCKAQVKYQVNNEYRKGKCDAVQIALNLLEDFKDYSFLTYLEKLNDELSTFSSQSAYDVGFRMMMRIVIKMLMGCEHDN